MIILILEVASTQKHDKNEINENPPPMPCRGWERGSGTEGGRKREWHRGWGKEGVAQRVGKEGVAQRVWHTHIPQLSSKSSASSTLAAQSNAFTAAKCFFGVSPCALSA